MLACGAQVIDTIAARSVTMFTLCLPASYLFYRNQGGVEPWYDWLQTDATAKGVTGSDGARAPTLTCCDDIFLLSSALPLPPLIYGGLNHK